jgi:hypothetical protein
MANFNSAEKRFPNAVEGMLAGRGLAFEGDAAFNMADLFWLEDDLTAATAAIAAVVHRGALRRAKLIKSGGPAFHKLEWLPLFDQGEIGNDNTVSNHPGDINKHKAAPYLSVGEEIIRELGRLTPGWAGAGSVAPSHAVLRDVLTVTTLLPTETVEPETEVDPDDGSVILRWLNDDCTESFSLSFLGRGEVGGFLSTSPQTPAWRLRVSETSHVMSKIMSEGVVALITR